MPKCIDTVRVKHVNGPLKMRSLGKFYSSLGISHNLLMGLGAPESVSVGHIFACLSSHYIFFVLGSDFKMPFSASLGFTIRHPLNISCCFFLPFHSAGFSPFFNVNPKPMRHVYQIDFPTAPYTVTILYIYTFIKYSPMVIQFQAI